MENLFKYYLPFAVPVLLLFSCDQEEIIQLDLNESPTQFVIEGSVTDEAAPCKVRITRTVHFDQPNDFPAVSGAVVVISDDAGQLDTLIEKDPGVYESAEVFTGVAGRTYTLQVWVEGHHFMASSAMPDLVPFDDLKTIRLPFGGSDALVMTPVFNDPPGLGNNYQFIQSNNGVRQPFIFVMDDRNNDGSQVSSPLLDPDLETMAGDTVTIEMRTIDRATYKYFVALAASNGNGPNASVPANPNNNFEGNCLGYFAAYTVQRRTMIVE